MDVLLYLLYGLGSLVGLFLLACIGRFLVSFFRTLYRGLTAPPPSADEIREKVLQIKRDTRKAERREWLRQWEAMLPPEQQAERQALWLDHKAGLPAREHTPGLFPADYWIPERTPLERHRPRTDSVARQTLEPARHLSDDGRGDGQHR